MKKSMLVIATGAWIVLSCSAMLTADDKKGEGKKSNVKKVAAKRFSGPRVALKTAYMNTPLEGAHRIEVTGLLTDRSGAGVGRLVLDSANSCITRDASSVLKRLALECMMPCVNRPLGSVS